MIGYGSEDSHFVLELTYNYGIKEYVLGNEYNSITIKSKKAVASIRAEGIGSEFDDEDGKGLIINNIFFPLFIMNR